MSKYYKKSGDIMTNYQITISRFSNIRKNGDRNHFQNCRNRNFDSSHWTNFAQQRKGRHLNTCHTCRSCYCAFHGAFDDWRLVLFDSHNVQFVNYIKNLKNFNNKK